jgi:hypothetical protein
VLWFVILNLNGIGYFYWSKTDAYMALNNFYKTKRANGVEVVLDVFDKISKMQTLTSGLLQNVTIKV